MTQLADMHMHLGFADDPGELAHGLTSRGIAAFSNVVTPDEYEKLQAGIANDSQIRLGLGIHPWWIRSGSSSKEMLDHFDSLFPDTLYIGELGLDFYGSHADTRDMQVFVFEHIASVCANRGDCLISLHSVRAERELIDILEATGCIENCTCILHSYSGPSDQLKRAIELGFLFSIGPRMLSTKKGREYARVIPHERLLLETDLPAKQGDHIDPRTISDSLESTLTAISKIRGVSFETLAESVYEQSISLLDC